MCAESTPSKVTGDERYYTTEECPVIVGRKPNQKSFRSHRLLLAAFSDVFRAMFYGPLAEKEKEVELPEDDADAFEIMISCLITGEITPETVQDAIDVYRLADKYNIPHLRKTCVDYLLKSISAEYAIEIYEMATEFSEHNLRMRSFFYICENAAGILKVESFINSKFSTVQSIVSGENINVSSEIDVYNAVFRWLKEQCRRKEVGDLEARVMVEPLLTEIRFLTLTVAEFCEGPGKNKLLTDQEKLSILTNIVTPNAVELTRVCSKIKTKRHRQSATQHRLSANKSKLVRMVQFLYINQKSKVFSRDTCIYGVSFYLKYTCTSDGHAQFHLTIKNITKSTEIAKRFPYAPTGQNVVELQMNDSIFVGKGEECEISLTGDFPAFSEMYGCNGNCQLDEFYTSEYNLHFHDIFMYRI